MGFEFEKANAPLWNQMFESFRKSNVHYETCSKASFINGYDVQNSIQKNVWNCKK